jgi:hypothetical protein
VEAGLGAGVTVDVVSSPPIIMYVAEEIIQHITIKITTPMIIGVLDIFIIYTYNKCKDQFKPL